MREHELRQRVVSEMHLRRWPLLTWPMVIVQWVTMVEDGEREEELRQLDLARSAETQRGSSHRAGMLTGKIGFAWERHSEGSSLTLFCPDEGHAGFVDPASHPDLAAAMEWAKAMPGRILRATRILVLADDEAAAASLAQCPASRAELVSCHLGGPVRIWSDFRLRENGFGELWVAANGADPHDLSRIAQRLQELGNYRNKALLGLPVAQEAWPQLNDISQRVAALSARMANEAERDNELMAALSAVSLELMAVATASAYRMSATAAYAQLVEERLEQLEVVPIASFASLADFTQRRLLPAVRTCAAMTRREQELSARALQLSSLLRARIETRIENQNARLLHSMERSTTMQLRLQQLVEGLSVVALSYYLLSLLGYALKGAAHHWPAIDPELALGLLVVPVVVVVWLGVRIAKHRLLGRDHA